MSAVPLPKVAFAADAAPAASVKPRLGAVDVLRIAAVIGVAFYHAGLLNQFVALVGMHALIAGAVVFAAESRGRGTVGHVLGRRAVRLLPPWLFFGGLQLVFAIRSGAVKPWMFIIGGSLHLWFVPFIFVVTGFIAVVCRAWPWPKSWGQALLFAMVGLTLVYLEAAYTPDWVDNVPYWQFLDGATAALLAMAAISVPGGRLATTIAAAVLTLATVPLWVPFRSVGMMPLSPAGIGTLLFLMVQVIPLAANRLTDFLGRASYGLYIMHILAFVTVEKLVAKQRHLRVSELSSLQTAVCVLAAILFCLTAIAVLERTPAKRLVE